MAADLSNPTLTGNVACISLIGFRGSGKSTVAELLATRLGWRVVDVDRHIVDAVGTSIAEIFGERGESGFRALESEALATLLRERNVVVATGGGAVLQPENRRLLLAAGPVVWLHASAMTLQSRLQADPSTSTSRPPLAGKDAVHEVAEILHEREPLYAAVANHVITTDEKSPAQIADEILAWLNQCSA